MLQLVSIGTITASMSYPSNFVLQRICFYESTDGMSDDPNERELTAA
jgi:hypothetical protein